MRYAIWFNGNNWEEQAFMEQVDAALFIETDVQDKGYIWFITNEAGRDILKDKGVI